MLKIIQSLLYYTIKMSTPLLLCSIGGVFVQKTGTLNFALEAAINTLRDPGNGGDSENHEPLPGIVCHFPGRGHRAGRLVREPPHQLRL